DPDGLAPVARLRRRRRPTDEHAHARAIVVGAPSGRRRTVRREDREQPVGRRDERLARVPCIRRRDAPGTAEVGGGDRRSGEREQRRRRDEYRGCPATHAGHPSRGSIRAGPGAGTGRRRRLKPAGSFGGVWVRVPPRARRWSSTFLLACRGPLQRAALGTRVWPSSPEWLP